MSKEKIIHRKIYGANVVFYPMSEVRSIRVEFHIHSGSWFEKGDSYGAIHFLEHVMHLGTENFKNRFEVENYKEEYGIRTNAWTGPGSLGFWSHMPDTSFKEGMNLMSEIVFKPSFPETELSREASVVAQEYKDKWSNPSNRFWKAEANQLFGEKNLYVRDALGDPEYVSSLSSKELRAIWKEFVYPSNMSIVVVGNVDGDEVISILTEMLEPFSNDAKEKAANFLEVSPMGNYLWHKEDVKSVAMNINFITKGRYDYSLRERLTLGIGSYLLGGSSRSSLYKRLRHELGLVYGVNTRRFLLPTVGIFGVTTSVSPDKAGEALSEIRNVLNDFCSKDINKADFNRAQKYMDMQTLLTYDSIGSIAESLIGPLFWDNVLLTPEDYIEASADITAEEVSSALIEILKSPEYISLMSLEDPKLK